MAEPRGSFDALGLAAIVALVIVGVIATVDLIATGELEDGVLALVAGSATPLIAALIARRNGVAKR